MSASVWTGATDLRAAADTALNLAARLWFLVAVAGQWIFVAYVVSFYGGTALRGDFEAWNKALPHGYTPGDPVRNAAVAVHLILAVLILVGGPLQLSPWMRRHAPSFHRWNGRQYTLSVCLTSMAGLYMIWTRERADRLVQNLGISLDAVLIVTFAVLAVRHAVAGEIRTHRQWALRLFMVVNAGWFFRIGVMQRIFTGTFTDPFLNFWSFADYLLPLAILELYLRTKERGSAGNRFAMAAGLLALTVVMGAGLIAAMRMVWLPRM